MANDNLTQLWGYLGKQNKGFTVSLSQFEQDMQDDEKLRQTHEYLSKTNKGFTVDYDTFKKDMGMEPTFADKLRQRDANAPVLSPMPESDKVQTKEEKQLEVRSHVDQARERKRMADDLGVSEMGVTGQAFFNSFYDSTVGVIPNTAMAVWNKILPSEEYKTKKFEKQAANEEAPYASMAGSILGTVASLPAAANVVSKITKINPGAANLVGKAIHRGTVGAVRTAAVGADEVIDGDRSVKDYSLDILQSVIQHATSVLPEELMGKAEVFNTRQFQYLAQVGEGAATQWLTDKVLQRSSTLEEYAVGAVMDAYFAEMDISAFKNLSKAEVKAIAEAEEIKIIRDGYKDLKPAEYKPADQVTPEEAATLEKIDLGKEKPVLTAEEKLVSLRERAEKDNLNEFEQKEYEDTNSIVETKENPKIDDVIERTYDEDVEAFEEELKIPANRRRYMKKNTPEKLMSSKKKAIVRKRIQGALDELDGLVSDRANQTRQIFEDMLEAKQPKADKQGPVKDLMAKEEPKLIKEKPVEKKPKVEEPKKAPVASEKKTVEQPVGKKGTTDHISKDEQYTKKMDIKDGKVRLVHYGPTKLEGGEIKPEKFGKGRYSRKSKEAWDKPRSFFYVKDADKEQIVTQGDKSRYDVEMPADKLYPFNKDPEGFLKQHLTESGQTKMSVEEQMKAVGQKAEEAGYDGMIMRWRNTYRVDVWKPQKPISPSTAPKKADFKQELEKALDPKTKETFGLLTAENPRSKKLSADQNKDLNNKMLQDLREMGYEPIPVGGKYEREESSFYVPGLKEADALKLGEKYGQESVATERGLIYTSGSNKGKMHPAKGTVEFNNKLDDYYTEIETSEGKQRFSVQYDFDKLVPVSKADAPVKDKPKKKLPKRPKAAPKKTEEPKAIKEVKDPKPQKPAKEWSEKQQKVLKIYGGLKKPEPIQKAILNKDASIKILGQKMDGMEVEGDLKNAHEVGLQIDRLKREIKELVRADTTDIKPPNNRTNVRVSANSTLTDVNGKVYKLPSEHEFAIYKNPNGTYTIQDGQKLTVKESELKKIIGRELTDGDIIGGGKIHHENPDPSENIEIIQKEIETAYKNQIETIKDDKITFTERLKALRSLYNKAFDTIFTFGHARRTNIGFYNKLMSSYGKRNAALENKIAELEKEIDIKTTEAQRALMSIAYEDKRIGDLPKELRPLYKKLMDLNQFIETRIKEEGLYKGNLQERLLEGVTKKIDNYKKGVDNEEYKNLLELKKAIENMRYLPHNIVAERAIEQKFKRMRGTEKTTGFIKRVNDLSFRYRQRKGLGLLRKYMNDGLLRPQDLDFVKLTLESYDRYMFKSSMKGVYDYANDLGYIKSYDKDLMSDGWERAEDLGIRVPEYKNKIVHPALATSLKEINAMKNFGSGNILRKVFGMVKIAQFIKPQTIIIYDVVQKIFRGMWNDPISEIKDLKAAWNSVTNKDAFYQELNEKNVFQFPYETPKVAKDEQIKSFIHQMDANMPGWRNKLDKITGIDWSKGTFKPWHLMRLFYTVTSNAAWFGDKLIRTQSVMALKRMGISTSEAARYAGRAHGAYSEVSTKMKRAMSMATFVHTFRFLMPLEVAKVVTEPVQAAIQYKKMADGSADVPPIPASRLKLMAKSIIGTLLLPTAMNLFMKAMGFEDEGKSLFDKGWKYRKKVTYVNDRGREEEAEIVVGLNYILNMPAKYYHRLTYYNPIDKHPRWMQAANNLVKWEVHPVWRIFFWDIVNNRASFGKQRTVWDVNADPPVQLAQVVSYAFKQSFQLWNKMSEVGLPDTKAVAKQKKIMEQGLSNLEKNLVFFLGYSYVRMDKKERQTIAMKSLEKEYYDRAYTALSESDYKIDRRIKLERRKGKTWDQIKKKYGVSDMRRYKKIEKDEAALNEWYHKCVNWIENDMK